METDYESDVGSNNSDFHWKADNIYIRNDGKQIILPQGKSIAWEQFHERITLTVRDVLPEEQEDLVDNTGTKWINASKYEFVHSCSTKDNAARQGSNERRRSNSLPPGMWRQKADSLPQEEPICTPSSSSTDDEQEL